MKTVFLVKQNVVRDDCVDCLDLTIYVCSTLEEAARRAQILNKRYGTGCEFDDDNDYITITNYDNYHYYEVEAIQVDEPFASEEDE